MITERWENNYLPPKLRSSVESNSQALARLSSRYGAEILSKPKQIQIQIQHGLNCKTNPREENFKNGDVELVQQS